MALKKTFIFVVFLSFGYETTKSESVEFKWKFNLDADDAANFVEDKTDSNCRGFYFPDFKDICMMSLHKLRTNEIVFPKSGDVYLKEGAEIIFDPTNQRCIKVKPTSYKNFLDPNSWTSNRTGNRAVPDLERTPCHCDHVTFPNNSLFAMNSPNFLHPIKKIDYGLKIPDQSCPLIISTIDQRIFSIGFCEDDKICQMRQNSRRVLNELCPLIDQNEIEKDECSEGVELLGHCTKFCGGVIRVKSDFYIQPSKILPFNSENFDVYSSKIIQDDDFIIQQISITDKGGFKGESTMKLVENEEEIERLSKKMGVKSIEILISGRPKNGVNKNVLIVFCTLIFVVGGFGAIFAIFEKNYFNLGDLRWDWVNNRNLARYSQALRRSVIFSRFEDNENVSIAGSVLNLQREEFDNPLYTEGDNQNQNEDEEK